MSVTSDAGADKASAASSAPNSPRDSDYAREASPNPSMLSGCENAVERELEKSFVDFDKKQEDIRATQLQAKLADEDENEKAAHDLAARELGAKMHEEDVKEREKTAKNAKPDGTLSGSAQTQTRKQKQKHNQKQRQQVNGKGHNGNADAGGMTKGEKRRVNMKTVLECCANAVVETIGEYGVQAEREEVMDVMMQKVASKVAGEKDAVKHLAMGAINDFQAERKRPRGENTLMNNMGLGSDIADGDKAGPQTKKPRHDEAKDAEWLRKYGGPPGY